MICYRGRKFCTYYKDCAKAIDCTRPLTPEVQKAAEKWWGSDEAPIDQFMDKPECWLGAAGGEG